MSDIRPEVSRKKGHYINKERYYELVHFCRQYQDWVTAMHAISPYPVAEFRFAKPMPKTSISDPVDDTFSAMEKYKHKIDIVEKALDKSCPQEMRRVIFESVTKNLSFSKLNARRPIPCGRDQFYSYYRAFFYELNLLRD